MSEILGTRTTDDLVPPGQPAGTVPSLMPLEAVLSAPKNMAKRAAAGTLALAVCLSGGVALAGAANAALPAGVAFEGKIPVAPLGTTGQAADNLKVSVGTTDAWVKGDRIVIALDKDSKAFFDTMPTVAVKQTDTAKAAETAPTLSAPVVVAENADGKTMAVAVTFTNERKTSENKATYEILVSGHKLTVPATLVGTEIEANVWGETTSDPALGDVGYEYDDTYFGNAGAYADVDDDGDVDAADVTADTTTATALLSYATSATISIPAGQSLLPGVSEQAIAPVTFTEAIKGGAGSGAVTVSFWQGTDQVKVANVAAAATNDAEDGTDFAIKLTAGAGSSTNIATPASQILVDADGNLSVTVNGYNTNAVDSFTLSNIRLNLVGVDAAEGPIVARLDSAMGASLPDDGTDSVVISSEKIAVVSSTTRVGGIDRYATASGIATAVNANPTTVILANGENASGGVDALSANHLAGAIATDTGAEVPVLLTQKGSIPSYTLNTLRLMVQDGDSIVLAGGESAISASVVKQIEDWAKASDIEIGLTRVEGDDRYETAAVAAITGAAALEAASLDSVPAFTMKFGGAPLKTALVASGTSTADALAAGQVAYAGNIPLLLTKQGSLPAYTKDALSLLEIKQVVVLGGETAVSAGVAKELEDMGIAVVRKGGDNRYATATQLLDLAVDGPATVSNPTGGFNIAFGGAGNVHLANGESFADALVAGPLAGSDIAPLLLTKPGTLSGETAAWIKKSDRSTVIGVGGTTALPNDVLKAANDSADGAS